MTKARFDQLPKAEDLPDNLVEALPIGTQFICRKTHLLPKGVHIIGQTCMVSEGYSPSIWLPVVEVRDVIFFLVRFPKKDKRNMRLHGHIVQA